MSQYSLNCVLKFLFPHKRLAVSNIQNTYPTRGKALRKAIWHNFLPLKCNKSFVGNKANTTVTSVFSVRCVVEYLFIYLFVFIDESISGPGSRLIFLSCRTDCWWRKMCTRLLWFGNRGQNWRTKSSNKEVQWVAILELHTSTCACWRKSHWFLMCIQYKMFKRVLITENAEQDTRTACHRFRVTTLYSDT